MSKRISVAVAGLVAAAVLAPASAGATTGPCYKVLEEFECIDPQRVVYDVACPIGEAMGWHCIDRRR